MRPRQVASAALVLALSAAAMPAAGFAEPHVRNGWYGGVGYGGCWAKVELKDTQKAEWSGTLNLRAGYALHQNLLLGAEFMRWSKDYEYATLQGDVPVGVTLAGAVLAVTYFPGNAGFMLRGGLGVAMADVTSDPPPSVDSPVPDLSTEPGLAAMVSIGYEVRLTPKFALGADFDVMYLGVSEEALERAYVYGVNLQFNWYW